MKKVWNNLQLSKFRSTTGRRLTFSDFSSRSQFDYYLRGEYITDYHYLAYLLDPRYKGIDLDSSMKKRCYELLLDYCSTCLIIDQVPIHDQKEWMPTEKSSRLIKSFRSFRDDLGDFSCQMYAYTKGVDDHPKRWWEQFLRIPAHQELAVACVRIFSIPAASASVERCFSTLKWLQSDERSRMKEETVQMLMAVVVTERFSRESAHLKKVSELPEEEVSVSDDENENIEEEMDIQIIDEADIILDNDEIEM